MAGYYISGILLATDLKTRLYSKTSEEHAKTDYVDYHGYRTVRSPLTKINRNPSDCAEKTLYDVRVAKRIKTNIYVFYSPFSGLSDKFNVGRLK